MAGTWLVRISIALGVAALGVAVSFLVFGGAPIDVVQTQTYPQSESVPLAGAACNPVTSTYPDGTSVQTLADAVRPPGNLRSLWMFNLGAWLGYSPQYPHVSDLMDADMLDVLFVCVFDPGEWVRPLT